MPKQSSIEWLWQNLTDDLIGELTPKQIHEIYKLVEQAIQMHKEEIIKTYRDGRSDQQSQKEARWYNRNAEYYYNEQYGGNK